MSKKYSTEGLIDALNRKTRGYGFADIQENEIDAIIARLRAADRLCEVARGVLVYLGDHFWESANIDESMTGERILTPLEKNIVKAIAEYEEGK